MSKIADAGRSTPSGFWVRVIQRASALPGWKKAALLLALVLAMGGVTALTATQRGPQFVTLFSGLELQDAAEVCKILLEAKIPYRLESGGSAITVGESQVAEARLACASKGVPRGGGVGLEIFDKSNLGSLSEFGERIRYQRGLQGELARSVQNIDGVETARVLLSMPESEVFAKEQKVPSASVSLRLRPGVRLSTTGVSAIVSLVSKAVPGLAAENISVSDQRGQTLWGGQGTTTSKRSATDEDAVERFEHRVEGKVSDMMERLVGEGHCIVSVSASLDLTEKEIRTEKVLPGGGNGQVKSRQVVDESYHAASRDAGTSVPTPMLTPMPTASPRSAAATSLLAGARGNNDYHHKNLNEQYEMGRETSHEVRPPGAVKQLHVSVLLDEQALGTVGTGRVQELVATAAGIDSTRGDTVRVEALPFHKQTPAESAGTTGSARPSSTSTTPSPTVMVAGAAAAILACVFVLAMAGRRARRGRIQAEPEKPVAEEAAVPEAAAVSTDARAAALLRSWMASEGSHAN